MDETRENPSVETRTQIMFYDTDCAAVVHNLAYLRIIEAARTLLAESLGWKLADMSREGVYPVLVRTEIDYRRPAGLGDVVATRGVLERFGRTRFWCRFEMTREGDPDGEILVACRQCLALVRMPPGKVLRLPAEWRDRFGHLYEERVFHADTAGGAGV